MSTQPQYVIKQNIMPVGQPLLLKIQVLNQSTYPQAKSVKPVYQF